MNLEEWIVSETPISVQAQFLTPDVTCAVAISSTGEGECSSPTPALPITGIVAGISVCIAVLILIVALVVVAILVRYRRKSSSFTLQRDLK